MGDKTVEQGSEQLDAELTNGRSATGSYAADTPTASDSLAEQTEPRAHQNYAQASTRDAREPTGGKPIKEE